MKRTLVAMVVVLSAVIDRTDFGMTSYPGVVGNSVTLTIDAELVQPAAPGTK